MDTIVLPVECQPVIVVYCKENLAQAGPEMWAI